jgi:voltage-gated potassium channel
MPQKKVPAPGESRFWGQADQRVGGVPPAAANTRVMNARSAELERRLRPVTIAAAIFTIPFLILEGQPTPSTWNTVGFVGDYAIWVVFLVEVIALLAVADSRRRWIVDHPLAVAIVVLTPPFLFAIPAFRALRVLGLVRLLQLGPLVRHLFTRRGLRNTALLTLVVLLAGAEAFHAVEGVPFGDAVYWAITMMTGVGSGGFAPHTTAGRVVASIVMIVGVGFVALLTGAIAQQFLATDVVVPEGEERDVYTRIRQIGEQLRELEEQARREAARRGMSE